jgi:putative Mg2+ transporter-C (MgtC) family protein
MTRLAQATARENMQSRFGARPPGYTRLVAIADWDLAARLALAGTLGALVGFEREAHNHPAGMRTHALVGLGACLFTIAGAYGFTDVNKGSSIDPARVAAQVATGIGFIGAGAIMRSGLNVRGLTTAATLWLVAALGVAVGAGAYLVSVIAFAVVLAVLVGLRLVKPLLLERMGPTRRVLVVEYERGHGTLGPILEALETTGSDLGHLQLDDANGVRRASIEIGVRDPGELEPTLRSIARRDEVVDVRLEEGTVPGGVAVGDVRDGDGAAKLSSQDTR